MNDDGTMNEEAGKYAGMDRFEAREALVKDLKKEGYLIKEMCIRDSYLFDNMDNLKVKMKKPDLVLRIEVRQDAIYISNQLLHGAGGMPVGTAGRAAVSYTHLDVYKRQLVLCLCFLQLLVE